MWLANKIHVFCKQLEKANGDNSSSELSRMEHF